MKTEYNISKFMGCSTALEGKFIAINVYNRNKKISNKQSNFIGTRKKRTNQNLKLAYRRK